MRFLITLLAVGFTNVAAVPANSQRIVGGQLALITQYPEIASLLYSGFGTNYRQACGGCILTTKSILTAAHCPFGDAVYKWRVRVGSSFANSGGTVHTLESVIIHSSYNSRTHDSDIAILRTASTITYGRYVKQASIASSNYYLADNQPVWAAGWGTTSFGGTESEQLRRVQLWIINQGICKSRYANLGYAVTDNMLCSGWLDVGGRDQCQGDSGGPLYHNKSVVVGVCSWGQQCALAAYPGVNTRVSRFTPWIQANA